jgi:transposase
MARSGTESEREPLSPEQRVALEALLTGASLEAASEKAGRSKRTIYRWMQEGAFAEALKVGDREKTAHITRMLTRLAEKAVDVLGNNMAPNVPPSTQVQAARSILDRWIRLKELNEIEERLSRLEDELAIQDSPRESDGRSRSGRWR